ncbi:hypothetical protein EJP67_02225 [Variovorax guangxiensis]|uniref:Transcriptional repressor NrdR-like N-terminal domain-containing protein n=1 Tax=Variovorax guangxiensis TaxID=1775474 RepID=A0A3S0ZKQ6_9BURK|nr:hypothetical protein EJP67_02225 [Variovorax guangxiensis]
MKCPSCSSSEQRVLHTRTGDAKITRLRGCAVCAHRWTTVEIDAGMLSRMEKAAAALHAFAAACRDFDDPAT